MTTAQPTPRARRARLRLLGALLLVAGVLGGAAYLLRDALRDEWALRQFRRAAANDDPALPQRRDELLKRLTREEDRLDLAVRLADDPDPRVRAASVAVLLAGQPRAQRRDAAPGVQATVRFTAWRTRVHEAVKRLLKDSDEAVRLAALRGASELEAADNFGSELTESMKGGTPAERVVVAESLAHWNGTLLYQVVGDANQPAEARLAAMRGLDAYGDREVAAWSSELRQALEAAVQSGGAELRLAAVGALRHVSGAARAWLHVLEDEKLKELHAPALRIWIDSLGSGSPVHWSDTHDVWFRSSAHAFRCGLTTHVLCEGAKLQIEQLERAPVIGETDALRDRQGPAGRAFDVQLARLGNVLSVASAAHWYCNAIDDPPVLAEWLPDETPDGASPKRGMKPFVFREAKPVWEWCLARKGAYPTRFLTAGSVVRCYNRKQTPNPVPVRPLGAVLDELALGQEEFDRLRARYDGK